MFSTLLKKHDELLYAFRKEEKIAPPSNGVHSSE
jgi:hypothetical protein